MTLLFTGTVAPFVVFHVTLPLDHVPPVQLIVPLEYHTSFVAFITQAPSRLLCMAIVVSDRVHAEALWLELLTVTPILYISFW